MKKRLILGISLLLVVIGTSLQVNRIAADIQSWNLQQIPKIEIVSNWMNTYLSQIGKDALEHQELLRIEQQKKLKQAGERARRKGKVKIEDYQNSYSERIVKAKETFRVADKFHHYSNEKKADIHEQLNEGVKAEIASWVDE
ncbi:hypothetical protein [Virgibacillus chiguensis]|uniref:Uncharacterized protein n=1 Tax=Virgibacillus chiguensis TaxID=411959 RepID=A0A1M5RHT6_9BACI|nr:hypothetical protein [Virgibacillus chiguensis]SHH25897.1 hypothetical protein SAMN05421807_105168 [Virgibacillus chiguensis]